MPTDERQTEGRELQLSTPASPVDEITQGVPDGKQRCSGCGSLLGDRTVVCPNCGTDLGTAEPTERPAPSSRRKAVVLGGLIAFLGGGLLTLALGGLAGVFLPLAGYGLGGAVAGSLRGSAAEESMRVGAIAAAIPWIVALLPYGLLQAIPVAMDGTDTAMEFLATAAWTGLFLGVVAGAGLIGGALGALASRRRAPNAD